MSVRDTKGRKMGFYDKPQEDNYEETLECNSEAESAESVTPPKQIAQQRRTLQKTDRAAAPAPSPAGSAPPASRTHTHDPPPEVTTQPANSDRAAIPGATTAAPCAAPPDQGSSTPVPAPEATTQVQDFGGTPTSRTHTHDSPPEGTAQPADSDPVAIPGATTAAPCAAPPDQGTSTPVPAPEATTQLEDFGGTPTGGLDVLMRNFLCAIENSNHQCTISALVSAVVSKAVTSHALGPMGPYTEDQWEKFETNATVALQEIIAKLTLHLKERQRLRLSQTESPSRV